MADYTATIHTSTLHLDSVIAAVGGRKSGAITAAEGAYVECEVSEASDMAALEAIHALVDPTGADVREIRIRRRHVS